MALLPNGLLPLALTAAASLAGENCTLVPAAAAAIATLSAWASPLRPIKLAMASTRSVLQEAALRERGWSCCTAAGDQVEP